MRGVGQDEHWSGTGAEDRYQEAASLTFSHVTSTSVRQWLLLLLFSIL